MTNHAGDGREKDWQRRLLIVLAAAVTVWLLTYPTELTVLAQTGPWSQPTPLSPADAIAWFPDLTADPFGTVHVVWCRTGSLGGPRHTAERVDYTRRDGTGWLPPNDIVPPSPEIVRSSVTADRMGYLHLLFGGSVYDRPLTMYHQRAFAAEAWAAGRWSSPRRINQGTSYMGDISADSHGVLHLVYDDTLAYGDDTQRLADIYYRRSDDGGQTWSPPLNLAVGPETGSARAHLEIDDADVLHVTWDEGWDRLSGVGAPTYGAYTYSSDGGDTWAKEKRIRYPDGSVAQTTVGSDGQGGVVLVWRSTEQDKLFFRSSATGGRSWSVPAAIADILARSWTTPFDKYDMATDDSGDVHLLLVGRDSPDTDTPLGVYHLTWDGTQWSAPLLVFAQADLYPEYPQLVVHEGNQLHAAWFTREDDIWSTSANRRVWYAQRRVSAPHQQLTAWSTPSPEPPTPRATEPPIPTPFPTIKPDVSAPPPGLHTDGDDTMRVAIALTPVVLIIAVVLGIRRRWFR